MPVLVHPQKDAASYIMKGGMEVKQGKETVLAAVGAQGGTRTHTPKERILSAPRLPIPPQGHMVRVVGLEPTRHQDNGF